MGHVSQTDLGRHIRSGACVRRISAGVCTLRGVMDRMNEDRRVGTTISELQAELGRKVGDDAAATALVNDLVGRGLLYDTGFRRNGEIVWCATELGKKLGRNRNSGFRM
jgi:tetrahydromethanopterin S-methyltransferase subunit G